MLASLALYAVLPLLLSPSAPAESPLPLVLAVLITAVGVGVASVFVHQLLLVRPARSGNLDIHTPEGAARRLQIQVFCWGLAESVAIGGLVLWLLLGQAGLLYPFLAGSALLLVIFAPRETSLRTARDLADPDVKIG